VWYNRPQLTTEKGTDMLIHLLLLVVIVLVLAYVIVRLIAKF
jgi:flagellar biogenesis protein FliO